MTVIKERPILFSAPMVRAILDGRKTQTRRIIKPQPDKTRAAGKTVIQVADYCTGAPEHGKAYYWRAGHYGTWNSSEAFHCPQGKPGDRLWVRETFYSDDPPVNEHVYYRADGEDCAGFAGETFRPPWTPSIYMPRNLSRIDLLITDIRAERLQDISEAEAVAEGIKRPEEITAAEADVWEGAEKIYFDALNQPRAVFRRLWESINGADSWAANPWVWVITFERVKP